METLFRLMLVRPPVAQDPENPSIDLTQASSFQDSIRQVAAGEGDARAGAREVANAYVATAAYLASTDDNPLAAPLSALAADLDELESSANLKPKDIADAVTAAFGSGPKQVVKAPAFNDMLTRLRDSLLAIKILQAEHSRPIEELTRQLRTAEVVARAAGDGAFPDDAAALRRWRRRALKLPLTLAGSSVLSTRAQQDELRKRRQEQVDARRARVEELLDHHRRLQGALKELGELPATAFRESVQSISATALPPDRLRLTAALTDESTFGAELRALQVEGMRRGVDLRREPESATAIPAAGASVELAKALISSTARVAVGRTEFNPLSLPESGFTLAAGAAATLSEPTVTLLKERAIDLSSVAVDKAANTLQAELVSTTSMLEQLAGHPTKRSYKRVGDALVMLETPVVLEWGVIATGGWLPFPLLPLDGRIPHTRGAVSPAGIGDLLVVKQQLIGYEGADVAHIENVLKGEKKVREHTRREATEVVSIRETEVTTAEEHELETADRFEMSRETSETIKEDISIKAGLKVSGKYGPVVEFAVSAEGSYSRSKEEATKTASKFSQDVTERSAKKVAERVLERTQRTITTETTEKNVHEINNVPGNGHIAGVYQWVSKVYRAQLFNYGLRTMFDFMVPEPAAFLIAAMASAHKSATTLVKPPAFTLTPSQLSEWNYSYWVKLTGATDVTPPPELYRTKAADFKASGGDHNANYNHAGQIAIDDGYRAIYGSVGVVRNIWESDNTVDVVLGRRTQRMPGGTWMWTTTLDDERDAIPFAIDTFHVSQVAVAIEVKTIRTDRAMEKWRLDTFSKLQTAHQALVADYEEKLAALELQAGVAIRGNNPAANLRTIEDELKKHCLSILTDQHFDLFDAIETSAFNGLPQIDLYEAEGEGPYVRFFEQAFEWEHMTWVTYPYFWGRKDQWDDRIAYDDPDPAFSDFLRAGFCRVSVPARPGFEGAIDHFLTFGETWNGGPLPAISSPLYLPIADEIAERLDRPGEEIPQGDPWTVRIPTNLVHLRPDDQLPTWQQNAAGEWVEA